MDAVNAELALEENAANLKNRISEVETQFHDEMNTMYDLIAQDYLADAEDAYYNKDNTFSIREIEVRNALRRLARAGLTSIIAILREAA